MKCWVVKVSDYGSAYWKSFDDGYKVSTDLKNCDKFRFWLFAFLFYIDQIAYGSKIVKVRI